MIARLHIGDVGADLLDHAGGFVAEQAGSGYGYSPSMKCRSEWHSRRRGADQTSRGPGFGRLTSSITSGLLTSCRTAAFIWGFLVCFFLRHSGAREGASPKFQKGYNQRDWICCVEVRPGMTAAYPTRPKAIRQPRPCRRRGRRADRLIWRAAWRFP